MIAAAPAPESAASSAAPIPSSQRPIPLKGRADLVAEEVEFQGTEWWVLKDPVGLHYHRLHVQHYRVLRLLDGRRSLKDVRDQLAKEFPSVPLQLVDVQKIITSLHEQGLLWSQRPGQAGQLIVKQQKAQWQQFRQSLGSLLSLRLPGWDPDAALAWLYARLSWIFHPITGVLATLLVLTAWTLLLVQFKEFRSRLPEFQQFFGVRNLAWLWLTLSATKILHEFGHGLTCKRYGGECHEMGVMVLVFSPTLYCDVTDSWMLPNKWHRIWIGAAGIIVEVVLSAIAILIWWFTIPGLLNHLCLNVFFVSTITTVIFNANPLMRYDGYYMLSDFLGIPNLRNKATQALRDTFTEWCLGVTHPPDPLMPTTGRFWFTLYAIATTVYGWFILGAVLLFLYGFLKPYGLQSIGMVLAALSIMSIAGSLLLNVGRVLVSVRNETVSRIRLFATIVVASGLVVAGLMVPVPWYIESPFLIEPHNVAHVLTTTTGELVSFDVQPGDVVEKGQRLATLRNDELDEKLRLLEADRAMRLTEIAMLHALELSAEHALAQQQLESIDRRIADLNEQLADLIIIAPMAGRVVAAPRVPLPPASPRKQLRLWSGHIDDRDNLGCVVMSRTHLLSIAPDERMQAVLYLDQSHREDLSINQQIEIKFEHLADRTYRANIVDIAREHSEIAPSALSNRLGGSLASVTDSEGHERLTSIAYQARAVLDQETKLLKPGMRGTARFLVDRRSAAQWIWRIFRRTIHFRI